VTDDFLGLVRDTDPDQLRRVAQAWTALAARLAVRGQDVTDHWRPVGQQWHGGAGSAASVRAAGFSGLLFQESMVVARVGQALAEQADALARARTAVAVAEQTCASIGAVLRPDGTMSVRGGYGNVPDPDVYVRAREVEADLRNALVVAQRADRRTAQVLSGLAPRLDPSRPVGAGVPVSEVPPRGTSPRVVRDWWAGLSDAQRSWVLTHEPQFVGWLDGIPVADRDLANRILLDRQRADLVRQRAGIADLLAGYPRTVSPRLVAFERDRLAAVDAKLAGLDRIFDRLHHPGPDQPAAYLIGIDTAGDGRAVISVGNPDLAANAVTYVPGTGARLGSISGDLTRLDRMVAEATRMRPDQDSAAILWLGYDAPDSVPDAIGDSFAMHARADLDGFTDGLRVTHDGPVPSHNVIIGHSYGSTVVGFAARDNALDVDDMIFVGSPGVGVDHAVDLHIDPYHVWASQAANDPIQYAVDLTEIRQRHLIHGLDPTEPAFGGVVFASDPGDPLSTMHAHSQYWDPRSRSLDTIAAIITRTPLDADYNTWRPGG
jgi:hypothetical protein